MAQRSNQVTQQSPWKSPYHSASLAQQPWFVVNAAQDYTLYRPEACGDVAHFYKFEVDRDAKMTMAIPDGCIDVIFDCDTRRPDAIVCGTTMEAKSAAFKRNHQYFGIRFHPGALPNFCQLSANELVDQQFHLQDVGKNAQSLVEQVVLADDFQQQVNVFLNYFRQFGVNHNSTTTRRAIQSIYKQSGNIKVADIANDIGCSDRTLLRLFQQDTGLTPKAFARIIRCQVALQRLQITPDVLASDLAYELGFADQAHFQREFKRLISTTPGEFRHTALTGEVQQRIRHYGA